MPKVGLLHVMAILLQFGCFKEEILFVGPSKLYFKFLHLSCQPFVERAMQSDEN